MNEIQLKPSLYVVDTCSFVAITEIYPVDVFPGVWEKIDGLIDDGILVSAEDVLEELSTKDDDLLGWAKVRDHIFKELTEEVQDSAIRILQTHANLIDIKNNKSSADPFIIATAQVLGGVVVTEEESSGGPERSKIPDVCHYYSIGCVSLLDMLRQESLKL